MAISGTHIIADPAAEFFFYALLMLLTIGIFIFTAMNYTYVAAENLEDSSLDDIGGGGGDEHETCADIVVPAINVPNGEEDNEEEATATATK